MCKEHNSCMTTGISTWSGNLTTFGKSSKATILVHFSYSTAYHRLQHADWVSFRETQDVHEAQESVAEQNGNSARTACPDHR